MKHTIVHVFGRIWVALVVLALLGVSMGWGPGLTTVWAGNTDNPLEQKAVYGTCADTAAYQVAVAGAGMFGTTSNTIHLNIPASATIERAWLYWTGRDPYNEGSGTIRFNGTVFSGIQIGGPAFWATNDFAYAYKADVTTAVSPGNNTYTVEDGYTGDPDAFTVPYGAALVVIYRDPGQTWPYIVALWDNMDIAQGSSEPPGSEGISPIVFTFEPAAVDRTLSLSTVVGGIAAGTDAKVYYLTGSGTPPSGDIYGASGVVEKVLPAGNASGGDGAFMTTFDDTLTIPAGHTWVAVQVRSLDGTGPQLHWIAETFQLEAACPRVNVTKTLVEPADGVAQVGDTVTYQIQIENTGNTTLEVVPLQDTYNTTYLSFTTANPAPDDSADDGTLNWSDLTTVPGIGDLNPGESATVQVTFSANASTQALPGDVTTNTATVSGATDQNDNTAPDESDGADVEISNPGLSITKERYNPAPPEQYVPAGTTVQFIITVQNTGDTVLNTVSLVDTYDTDYYAFQSATPAPDDSTDDGTLNWSNIGPLNPGESTNIIVTFLAEQSSWNGSEHAKIHNYAEASGTDENGDSVGPVEDTAFYRITHPAVSITKELVGSDTHVPIGGQLTYRITVQNTGDTTLEVVPVVDTFPTAYLDYHADTSGVTPTVDEGAGTVTWSDVTGAGSLAPGASLSFEVTFNVTDTSNPDTLTNRACVESATDENGDHPDDVCDEDNTLITTNPQVTVTKVRVTDSPVLVGHTVQFQITVQNTGDTTIDVLPLTDTFDATKLQFVSATPAPDSTTPNGTLTWNDLTGAGSLAPGGSVVITVNFQALASTTPGTTTNTATVSGATDEYGDPVPTASDADEVAILTPARIGDYAWVDTNGNGIQDSGEPPLGGVTVRLYTAGGTLVGTTTTDGTGQYAFTGLFPGDYYLVFQAPTGYVITAQNQGGDDTRDSDADPTTGQTAVTTLAEGENDTSWDAGFYQPVTIGDYVWEDVNGNGLQDDGSTGMPGVTVKLHYAGPNGTFGDGDDALYTDTTDGNGNYVFANLPPGNYKVEFIAPTGYVITFQDQGADNQDSDPDPSTGFTDAFAVTSGQTDLTRDAGMYRPITIGDLVWNDSDGDGTPDPGEAGLANVNLNLRCSGPDGTLNTADDIVASTQTDSDGIYHFTNLPPGTCQVTVDTPSGYVATTSTTVSDTLQSGETKDDADFGFITPTAVDLLAFTADVGPEGVVLTWQTRAESGVTGFVVQRRQAPDGPWTTVAAVTARGSEHRGAVYTVVDGRVTPGGFYTYRLLTTPAGQVLGPWDVHVPATWEPGAGIQSGQRIFMPMVTR